MCDFLISNHFDEEVVGVFRMNKICGSVLCSLNEADMKELGLMALGDRRRLQSFIKKEFPNATTSNTLKELEPNCACVSTTPSSSCIYALIPYNYASQVQDTSHDSDTCADITTTEDSGDIDDSLSVC